jgi:hypothetical protein
MKAVPFQGAVAQSIGFGPTKTQAQNEASFGGLSALAFLEGESHFSIANFSAFIGCPTSGSDVMPCLRKASVGEYWHQTFKPPGNTS